MGGSRSRVLTSCISHSLKQSVKLATPSRSLRLLRHSPPTRTIFTLTLKLRNQKSISKNAGAVGGSRPRVLTSCIELTLQQSVKLATPSRSLRLLRHSPPTGTIFTLTLKLRNQKSISKNAGAVGGSRTHTGLNPSGF